MIIDVPYFVIKSSKHAYKHKDKELLNAQSRNKMIVDWISLMQIMLRRNAMMQIHC